MNGKKEKSKNTLYISVAIVLGCLILGGAFYMIQANKQKSIEKQQQIELQAKTEQDNRDYIAKRKTECLTIYKTESDKFNNVARWEYHEPLTIDTSDGVHPFSDALNQLNNDKCEIIYTNNKGEELSNFY